MKLRYGASSSTRWSAAMAHAKSMDHMRAQPAHAADRFVREIAGILAGSTQRSRRLMGNSFGGLLLISMWGRTILDG